MPSSTNHQVKYVLLSLCIVLLLALLYTTHTNSISLQKTTATLEAVAAEAELAFAAAETAVAVIPAGGVTAQPPSMLALSSTTGPTIPLAGGIAFTYQTTDVHSKVFYPVDDWRVYRDFLGFVDDWYSSLRGSATVRLALVRTARVGMGPDEWYLFHVDPIKGASPVGWSEYTLLARPRLTGTEQSSAASEPRLTDEELIFEFEEGLQQKIITSTLFAVEPGAPPEGSLDAVMDAGLLLVRPDIVPEESLDTLGDAGLELLELLGSNPSRLLLADYSTGRVKHTLIVNQAMGVGGGVEAYKNWCLNSYARLGYMPFPCYYFIRTE